MELKQLLQNAGIVGAGGAGFPTYAKLADGADTLLVNAAECEPLLYTDYTLLREEMERVVSGAEAVLHHTGIRRALLCIKAHNVKALGLVDGEELGQSVFVKELPDVYPMGDEINMIYEATGRLVRPGALPITVGVIVMNAETVYNIDRALTEEMAVTEKWCMLGGAVEEPRVVRVPVGTRVRDLFLLYGIEVPAHHVVIDGGPSMGNLITWQTAVVKKNTKSILILPDNIPATQSKLATPRTVLAHCSSNCCQCTRCTDLCPRALLGYPLEPHRMVRSAVAVAAENPDLIKTATLCCNCGVCEILACCQGISPRNVINEYKKVLAKNKLRYVSDTDVTPSPDRRYRMVPQSRWTTLLGVDPYDRMPRYESTPLLPKRVEIYLSQHIGAPSVPCVGVGESVTVGQKIAESAVGLSVPQHASVSGKVIAVKQEKIVIERV